MPRMQFQQKNFRLKTTFDFGDQELTYTFEDRKKKVGASIPYFKIIDRVMYSRKMGRRRLCALVFCIEAFLIFAVLFFLVAKGNSKSLDVLIAVPIVFL